MHVLFSSLSFHHEHTYNHTCTSNRRIADVKAERTNEVESCAKTDAGASKAASVGPDLRVAEHDVEAWCAARQPLPRHKSVDKIKDSVSTQDNRAHEHTSEFVVSEGHSGDSKNTCKSPS